MLIFSSYLIFNFIFMFDMHFHSTRSDWYNKPKKIIKKASDLNLELITLTDHDIISSREFISEANSLWIESKSSVEISARNYEIEKSLHLTCYSNNFSKEIHDIVNNTRFKKQDMIIKKILKIKKWGFEIDENDFFNYYENFWKKRENLNRYNIAEYLFRNEKNINLAKQISWNDNITVLYLFREFLKEWWKFNDKYKVKIPDYEPSIEVCWELAKNNSAILSIAHPNFSFAREHISGFKKVLPYYIDRWVNAIEINSKASKKWLEAIYEAKKKYNLILTAGSDNHWIWKIDDKHWDFWSLNSLLSQNDKKLILKEFKNKLN
jgi:predicted metal-dependent phosphoesterase TrpH